MLLTVSVMLLLGSILTGLGLFLAFGGTTLVVIKRILAVMLVLTGLIIFFNVLPQVLNLAIQLVYSVVLPV